MSRAIIILGMHRSGTSLLAEVVHRWGAYGGNPNALMPADHGNQRGYWEYGPLVQFNEVLLAQADANWFVPPYGDEVFYKRAQDPQFRKAATELIASMQNNGSVWYWKDPRLGILLAFWQQLWQEATYIVPVRHPLDVAASIKKRNNFPVSASLLIWQYYILSILKHTHRHPRMLFVEYERMVNDPEDQCWRLCQFLDKKFGRDKKRDPGRVEKMIQAVSPPLRHNKSQLDFSEYSLATSEQIGLYAFLKQKIQNPAAEFSCERFPLYRGWREYLLTINALINVSSNNRSLQ